MVTLHKKIYDCLEDGPLTSEELIKKMPDEKPVSIRATITLHPELFIRISKGIVGRCKRDEYLAKFYELVKTEIPKTVQLLKCYLATGQKTLQEMYCEFPDIKEERIRERLSEDVDIEYVGTGAYRLRC